MAANSTSGPLPVPFALFSERQVVTVGQMVKATETTSMMEYQS